MPTPAPAPDFLTAYGLYLIIPAGILLALCVTVIVILIKKCYEHRRGGVTYVRDISKNIEDGRMGGMRSVPMNIIIILANIYICDHYY